MRAELGGPTCRLLHGILTFYRFYAYNFFNHFGEREIFSAGVTLERLPTELRLS